MGEQSQGFQTVNWLLIRNKCTYKKIIPHSVDKQVLLKEKVINSPSCEITHPMANKMKHDIYVPAVRQLALDNVPLRNGPNSDNFGEERMFIFFSIVKNDQKCPNKMIVCRSRRFWNIIQGLKVASYI